jgi:hypothetical protein
LTFAGALALLAVIGKYYATPLLAQARAALVKNIDEKGRIAYEADSSCFVTAPGVCTASFPPVPPGKNLVIEYISAGLIIIPSGPTPPDVSPVEELHVLVENPATVYPLPVFFRTPFHYGINSPVLIYVCCGQHAELVSDASISSAHIIGYLVDLTQ